MKGGKKVRQKKYATNKLKKKSGSQGKLTYPCAGERALCRYPCVERPLDMFRIATVFHLTKKEKFNGVGQLCAAFSFDPQPSRYECYCKGGGERDLVHGGSKQLLNQVGIKIRLGQLPMICKS